jgi:BirA family biotin operon repressor/biotin-[acetyl-CoA-carboxylase] ligase
MSQDRYGQQARFPVFRLMRVARTASTQEVVLRAAREGAGEGFVCLAAEQTAGRGRQGRAWVAPASSAMLASVLLRRSPTVAAGIPFAAGLALVDILASDYGVTAGLKWPNDVLIGTRKLAGILCEVEPATSTADLVAVALGIGVNLTVTSFPADIAAVSLHTLVPTPPDAESLLAAWGRALAVRIEDLEQGGIAALLGEWRRCAVGLGGHVTVHATGETIHGIALDVGDDGALLVESSGQIHRFLAADVHLGSATT